MEVKIAIEELRKRKIFVATPMYGGMCCGMYTKSTADLATMSTQYQLDVRFFYLFNESLITRARNYLVDEFLRSPYTHLMFIDADIEFDPEAVIRMIAMDKDLITGAYPKKTLPVDYAINLKFADQQKQQVRVDLGAVEVLDASTGFWLMKRNVVEKMIKAYPELYYVNDSSIDPKFNQYCYSFFDTIHDPDDNRYLSEDYTFCRRWQKIGGKIWLDPNTKLNHIGSYTFEGNVNKIFNWDATK